MAIIKVTAKTTEKEALELSNCQNKCGHCCTFGSGYVLTEEIKSLANHFKLSEEEFKKKYLEPSLYKKAMRFKTLKIKGRPYGKCVFYADKEKTCSIHEIKPLHCRIGTCNEHGQDLSTWFMINYLVDFTNEDDVLGYIAFFDFGNKIPGAEVSNHASKEILKKIKEKKGGNDGK